MRTRLGFFRNKYAIISAVVVALAVASWGLYPREAAAQQNRPGVQPCFATGHLTLQPGETMRLGMLLPAVQKVREAARFQLVDTHGNLLFDTQVSGDFKFDAHFDVFFEVDVSTGTGVFVITDGLTGQVVGKAETIDGILIGLLLPAVQLNGKEVPALGGNFQLFDAAGHTASFDVFFEIEVRSI